jgi:transposase InsO family protein
VAGLGAAFVVGPPRLAASGPTAGLTDQARLVGAVRPALVEYWRSGNLEYPPALRHVVDYWFRFHLVKGGIAALLLILFTMLAVLLWRMRLRGDRLGTGRRAALASAGIAAPLMGLLALVATMANIQGAVAPFASLLPMLGDGTSDTGVAATLAQARHQLAGSHRTSGYTPQALDAMVEDFTRYHQALAAVAAVAVMALLSLSVVLWRNFVRTAKADRATRRVLGWFAAFSALSAIAVAVVLVANIGTAADPAPALLAFFNGGS